MALIAQDGVSHIVVVGGLHVVEQDHVFQLHGIAHHAVGPHQGRAPDKRTVAHLSLRPNDAGRPQIGCGEHHRRFMHPDLGGGLVIFLRRQRSPQGQDQLLDPVQGLPGVLKSRQILPCQGVGEVQKFLCFQFHIQTFLSSPDHVPDVSIIPHRTPRIQGPREGRLFSERRKIFSFPLEFWPHLCYRHTRTNVLFPKKEGGP